MDTLYPIIRRARRPLLVQDTPPVVAGSVEPVTPLATQPPEPVLAVPIVKPKNAQASNHSESR